jgi:hypothetical protein
MRKEFICRQTGETLIIEDTREYVQAHVQLAYILESSTTEIIRDALTSRQDKISLVNYHQP